MLDREERQVRLTVPPMDWHAGLSVVFFEQDGEMQCMPEYRFIVQQDPNDEETTVVSVTRAVINLSTGSYEKIPIFPPLQDELEVDYLVCIREGSTG